MPCLLGHFHVIAQREACPLAGECTWLLEAFVWGQVWNLFLTSCSFLLLGGKTILWAIYKPPIENGYCACMPKICLFLLLIEVWPGNHLIGNILLATAWNWLYCTPDIFLFVVLPFANWTLSACHQLIFRETSPCIFFFLQISLKSRMPVKSAKRFRFSR